MTEENQKIMYDNFMRLSVEGTTDIQRKNCLQYAKNILESFPQFEKEETKKEIKEDKPISKKKSKGL